MILLCHGWANRSVELSKPQTGRVCLLSVCFYSDKFLPSFPPPVSFHLLNFFGNTELSPLCLISVYIEAFLLVSSSPPPTHSVCLILLWFAPLSLFPYCLSSHGLSPSFILFYIMGLPPLWLLFLYFSCHSSFLYLIYFSHTLTLSCIFSTTTKRKTVLLLLFYHNASSPSFWGFYSFPRLKKMQHLVLLKCK